MITLVTSEHLDRAKEVHKLYYQNEFDFPDFLKEFILIFSSVNESNELVSIGGIKTILEFIAITDPTKSVRDRHTSVYDLLAAARSAAKNNNYDQIHAFIQDPHWKDVMLRRGFRETKGQSLVIGV